MKGKSFNLTLTNLIYRLRKFKDIVYDEINDFMVDVPVQKYIADSIREQLESGYNGNDEFIADYRPYKLSTIKKKIKKRQPIDRVTLRDTGTFHRSLYVKRIAGGFAVMSDDKIVGHLQAKYKPSILRLSNKNLNKLLQDIIRPHLVKRLKERLYED